MKTKSPADKLVSLLTQFDSEQQAKSKRFNPFALPQYIQAARDWEKMKPGAFPIDGLARFFTTVNDDGKTFCLKPVRQFVQLMGYTA